MLGAEPEPGTHARPHHHRSGVRAAGEVAELRRLGHHHVEGDAEELDEHDLDDRTQPGGGGTDGGAAEPHLGDRRVPHPGRPVLVEQTLGRLERSLGDGHVLTHQDHRRVGGHGVVEGSGDRLAHAQLHPGNVTKLG